MQAEIAILISSPAKYLDAARTAEPTSGVELYNRYDNISDRLHSEFPELTKCRRLRRYRPTKNGSLLRTDLKGLDQDIAELLICVA